MAILTVEVASHYREIYTVEANSADHAIEKLKSGDYIDCFPEFQSVDKTFPEGIVTVVDSYGETILDNS